MFHDCRRRGRESGTGGVRLREALLASTLGFFGDCVGDSVGVGDGVCVCVCDGVGVGLLGKGNSDDDDGDVDHDGDGDADDGDDDNDDGEVDHVLANTTSPSSRVSLSPSTMTTLL